MNNHRDIFKEALTEVKNEELALLPSEDEIDYTFSRSFEEKQKELIKLQHRKKTHKSIRKRIAIVAIAAALLLLTMLYAAADRDRPFEFFYRLYDNYFALDFDKAEPTSDTEIVYKLAYLPDGYVEEFRCHMLDMGLYTTIYKKDELRDISLDQKSKSAVSESQISKALTLEEITINSIDVIYAHNDKRSLCYWSDSKYMFKLAYPSELGKEYLEKNVGKLIVDYVVYPEEITVPEGNESFIYPPPEN